SPVLLLLDNHVSHLYIPAIDLCKENHITLLSLSPHTSHTLQPLDRVVYGLLKTYIGSRCHASTRENPEKVLSIYDILGIVGSKLPRAMTQHNIIESFRCTGI
ncbi:tigger transposable element-derived protein, partial [Elysia marginata]